MSIIGTRPDMIKMSEIIKQLDKHTEHVLVHTGQNYDTQLSEVFYDDLKLRRPDYRLESVTTRLSSTIGNILSDVDDIILKESPDAVVILGDTNSALSGYMAKRRKIPFFHLEAGNRCFDDNVPEEINRRMLDHIADVNLCYTENSRRNLLAEGLPSDRIFLMGSPMNEVLRAHKKRITECDILGRLELEPGHYYIVSLHREENIDDDQNFINAIHAVNVLAASTKSAVLMSVHPRTKKRIESTSVGLHEHVIPHEPLGFLEYCKLQMNATCVISDSGTLAEESALLGFPAVTMRNTIERPEAIDAGSMLLCQPDAASLMNAVAIADKPTVIPTDYQITNTSERVLKTVVGYAGYVRRYVHHV